MHIENILYHNLKIIFNIFLFIREYHHSPFIEKKYNLPNTSKLVLIATAITAQSIKILLVDYTYY